MLFMFTEGSKSGKKHPLPIDLSTENKKGKRRGDRGGPLIEKDKMNKQMTT